MYSELLVLLDVIGHQCALLHSLLLLNQATAVYKTLMHGFPIVRGWWGTGLPVWPWCVPTRKETGWEVQGELPCFWKRM